VIQRLVSQGWDSNTDIIFRSTDKKTIVSVTVARNIDEKTAFWKGSIPGDLEKKVAQRQATLWFEGIQARPSMGAKRKKVLGRRTTNREGRKLLSLFFVAGSKKEWSKSRTKPGHINHR